MILRLIIRLRQVKDCIGSWMDCIGDFCILRCYSLTWVNISFSMSVSNPSQNLVSNLQVTTQTILCSGESMKYITNGGLVLSRISCDRIT